MLISYNYFPQQLQGTIGKCNIGTSLFIFSYLQHSAVEGGLWTEVSRCLVQDVAAPLLAQLIQIKRVLVDRRVDAQLQLLLGRVRYLKTQFL